MNKRKFFGGVAALSSLLIGKALASQPATDLTYVVPDGVKSIRIRSYVDGKEVIDRTLDVRPGQKFRITA